MYIVGIVDHRAHGYETPLAIFDTNVNAVNFVLQLEAIIRRLQNGMNGRHPDIRTYVHNVPLIQHPDEHMLNELADREVRAYFRA